MSLREFLFNEMLLVTIRKLLYSVIIPAQGKNSSDKSLKVQLCRAISMQSAAEERLKSSDCNY